MSNQMATADLADQLRNNTRSCDTQFHHFGKQTAFHGSAVTISCFQDNLLIKETLGTPGHGRVLVIDGQSSTHTALVGDLIAGKAIKNNWAGIIVLGAIRDSALINTLDIGIKALGTNPRKSTQTGTGKIDVPISFGGIIIHPGEWIYSDLDGIVVTTQPMH
jgi:regulator of ribonuclease activity A